MVPTYLGFKQFDSYFPLDLLADRFAFIALHNAKVSSGGLLGF